MECMRRTHLGLCSLLLPWSLSLTSPVREPAAHEPAALDLKPDTADAPQRVAPGSVGAMLIGAVVALLVARAKETESADHRP